MKTNKVILSTILGATLIFSSSPTFGLVNQTEVAIAEAASISFKDISSTHPQKAKIDKLVEMNVIAGFTDGTFGPSQKVNRGQFALFISRALNLPMPTKPQSFKDVGKTSSVYEGVVKAQAAGIIQGYPDGRFKAGEPITRGDMAIMLDRALQFKGSYTKKATLSYSDKGSIGKAALPAVERLTAYNVMGALSGSKFSASTTGDRLATVVSIYELLKTKNLLSDGQVTPTDPTNPSEQYPKGDIRNYTLAELRTQIGDFVITRRLPNETNGAIVVNDGVKEMYDDIHKANHHDAALFTTMTAKEYFDLSYMMVLNSAYGIYSGYYPKGEIVAVNGVAFRDTQWYPERLKNAEFVHEERLNNLIPVPPKEAGKFLIDLPAFNKDVVTYQPGRVDIETIAKTVTQGSNNDYYVDIKGLFMDTNPVNVANDGLTISYNGNVLKLTNNSSTATLNGQSVTLSNPVKVENNVVLAPFKSIADQLGLYYRTMYNAQRFEITNYPQPTGIRGWEE